MIDIKKRINIEKESTSKDWKCHLITNVMRKIVLNNKKTIFRFIPLTTKLLTHHLRLEFFQPLAQYPLSIHFEKHILQFAKPPK